MDYPIVIIAYEPADQEMVLEEKIIHDEYERIEFINRFKCSIKYRELNEKERYNLDPLSFVSEPTKKNKYIANAKSQNSFWRKTLKSIKSHIIQIILALLIAYLVYRLGWN